MNNKISVYNQDTEQVGELLLSADIFSLKENHDLIHQVMTAQLSNKRSVLAHTKDRSEVRGGGAKPWRQKGTGRARAGSRRSPIWIGGGITFGPTKSKNFKKKINKKMKQKAIFMVLSDRFKNNGLVILDKIEIQEYKTKVFNLILKKIESNILKEDNKSLRSILLINEVNNDKMKCSSSNLAGVKLINMDNINLLDLLKYRNLIISKEVVSILSKKYIK